MLDTRWLCWTPGLPLPQNHPQQLLSPHRYTLDTTRSEKVGVQFLGCIHFEVYMEDTQLLQ